MTIKMIRNLDVSVGLVFIKPTQVICKLRALNAYYQCKCMLGGEINDKY